MKLQHSGSGGKKILAAFTIGDGAAQSLGCAC
jgi:hypothetical protein